MLQKIPQLAQFPHQTDSVAAIGKEILCAVIFIRKPLSLYVFSLIFLAVSVMFIYTTQHYYYNNLHYVHP